MSAAPSKLIEMSAWKTSFQPIQHQNGYWLADARQETLITIMAEAEGQDITGADISAPDAIRQIFGDPEYLSKRTWSVTGSNGITEIVPGALTNDHLCGGFVLTRKPYSESDLSLVVWNPEQFLPDIVDWKAATPNTIVQDSITKLLSSTELFKAIYFVERNGNVELVAIGHRQHPDLADSILDSMLPCGDRTRFPPFDPSKTTIKRNRISITEANFEIWYDEEKVMSYADCMRPVNEDRGLKWLGYTDDQIMAIARRLYHVGDTDQSKMFYVVPPIKYRYTPDIMKLNDSEVPCQTQK